jgi:signal transduction histidine kinase
VKTRERVLISGVLISLLLFLSLILVVYKFEMDSMQQHSRAFAEEKKRIFEKMIDSELKAVERFCIDWAFWDDTYEFVESRDEKYVASNLHESTFKEDWINAMVFVNRNGEIVYARYFDENWVERDLPEALLSQEIHNRTGIALVDGKLMVIASKPILRTDLSGEERGYLMMARILGESWFSEISKTLNARISIGTSSEEYGKYIRTKEVFPDIFGGEIVFSLEFENSLYDEHVRTIILYVIAFLLILAAFSIPAALIIDRSLVSKIVNLAKFLGEAKPGDRIELDGTDEIRKLAGSVNELLSRIARNEEEIRFLLRTLRHDLANILASISGYLEIAKTEKNFEFVEKAEKQVERAIALINATKQIEKQEIAIYKISEIVEKLKNLFPIEVELRGDAKILADEGIYIVFSNLIDNSLKHGRATKVLIEIEKAGETIVKFRDNGKGFSDIAKEKVFKEEYSESGGGLGLLIVKRLVERYGGKIELLDRNTILMRFPNVP